MFFDLVLTFTLGAALVAGSAAPYSALSSTHRRDVTQQVAVACFQPPTSGFECTCPTDLNNNTGVLINVFPGYQCAYPGGACTWSDSDGSLQNVHQTNCPPVAPCAGSECLCPIDLNHDTGVLINQFTGYQCAYAGGACTWDFSGVLQNIFQTNCPSTASVCFIS
ncbi:hypothetical protein OBBRIDRAFT_793755 [Obba rivulosa]|uniref:SSCRP protein n=1 Tax=Obba rivulosa TaxID=1052685 RepID=A0A8E2AXK8_9APHY|nr:hypothetical protein OBBRIDRAFT_793755 [Obba rivulosa]